MGRKRNNLSTCESMTGSLSPLTVNVVSLMMILSVVAAQKSSKLEEVKVGVILNMETRLAKMSLSCLNMAISDFYESHESYNTRLVLRVRDSNKDLIEAASAALDLIKSEKVEAIIGPQTSTQANFVINLGDKAHIPIISFSATSPSLASLRSSYFFQAAQNDKSQVNAITSLVKAFGWSQVVPVYVDDEFGESIVPYLTDSLQNAGVLVPYRAVVSPAATEAQIESELYKLMTMQSRVFVVHMNPGLGSRLFDKAEDIGLMNEGCVWIVTNGVMDLFNVLNSSTVDAMQGVLGFKTYVPESRELRDFRSRWKRKFRRDNPTLDNDVVDDELNVFGLWAHDAAFALAMAVEKAFGDGNTNNGTSDRNSSSTTSTDLDTLGVSRGGSRLQRELGKIRFLGLAGEFSLVNGQLRSPGFEIMNVNSNGERLVGFWTPQSGLIRRLNLESTSTGYSTSRSNLGPIIWPGDFMSVPKGWVTPTNGKKLRVGVPLKLGNSSFIKLTSDPSTNRTQATGFCIEVFNAAMEAMPYAVLYEFVPFVKPNGESGGSYNDMIHQVYLGNFDAVAADVTIVSSRSKYVDFTLPYTESGVTMVVPIRGTKMKNAWVFLKPLTWDLWVTTCCFFVFIGFVIWALEHRINDDFRGPPSYQIGTSFWFSFSTMVFAHREKVVSNLGRFVVIIWCFVVLILTQSYTASLTSMLTVQQLRPTFTDVKELLENKAVIGFPKGSFVLEMLKDFIPFKDHQIKEYKSLQHLGELFANGDIVAAYDEIPYLKVFIATHCSSYAMVGPIYKTDGFGFAFPRGNPLAGDVSRAILNVTEGDKIKKIENAWFVSDTVCPDSSSLGSSASLGLNSFWGLFLIAGVTSLSALAIFVAKFLYQHRKILSGFHKEASVRQRIGVILGIFDEKDLSSHTFRKNGELQSGSPISRQVVMDTMNGSPNTNFPPSPSGFSNYSNGSEFFFPSHEEPVTPCSDHSGQRSPETTALELETIER